MILLYIAAGGAVGALARHGLGTWVQAWAGASFPWGTFAVNVLGSFLLGVAVRWMEAAAASPDVRAMVAVGLLGAFTTFSTYSLETVALLRDGAWGRGAAYALGSLALGLVGVVAGMAAAGWGMRIGSGSP